MIQNVNEDKFQIFENKFTFTILINCQKKTFILT